jgi:hypothetical protein
MAENLKPLLEILRILRAGLEKNMHNKQTSRRSFLVEAGRLAGGGWLALNTPALLAAGQAAVEQRTG